MSSIQYEILRFVGLVGVGLLVGKATDNFYLGLTIIGLAIVISHASFASGVDSGKLTAMMNITEWLKHNYNLDLTEMIEKTKQEQENV